MLLLLMLLLLLLLLLLVVLSRLLLDFLNRLLPCCLRVADNQFNRVEGVSRVSRVSVLRARDIGRPRRSQKACQHEPQLTAAHPRSSTSARAQQENAQASSAPPSRSAATSACKKLRATLSKQR